MADQFNPKHMAPVVESWIDDVMAEDGDVGEIDVRRFIRKEWPGVPAEVVDAVARRFIFCSIH